MISKFLSSKFSGYLSLITIASTLLLVWYIYKEGKKSCVNAQANQIVKEVEKYENKRIEVRKLDDDALRKRYCHWVYGVSYNECVATYTFVE